MRADNRWPSLDVKRPFEGRIELWKIWGILPAIRDVSSDLREAEFNCSRFRLFLLGFSQAEVITVVPKLLLSVRRILFVCTGPKIILHSRPTTRGATTGPLLFQA